MKVARPLLVIALLLVVAGAGSSTYTLKWGDTLSSVAKKFGVPVKAITAANGIKDADKVQRGETLTIPDKATAGVAVAQPIAAVSTPGAPSGKTHKVAKGDTLGAIAKKYEVTVDELRKLNAITDDRKVREGRVLQLPASANVPGTPQAICPVQGAGKWDFSNSFGAPRHGGSHAGNDIFAKRGTPVVAPMGGTLRRADGSRAGYAFYVDGDDGVTYYGAHLDSINVTGGRVEQGNKLGTVGTTGNAQGTPPHLHFEVRPANGPPIDPYGYLRQWCK